MDFDFIRKLTSGSTPERSASIAELLSGSGVECYSRSAEDPSKYISAKSASEFVSSDSEVYVAAADRERAAELVSGAGYEQLLCTDAEEISALTESEKAQRQLMRRIKLRQLICGGVFLLFFLFLLIKMFIGS